MHRRLWPGWSIAKPAKSRHRPFSARHIEGTWLEHTTVTTSMFMAFLLWGISHWKRQVQHRKATAENFSKLIQRMASYQVLILVAAPASTTNWKTVSVDSSLRIPDYLIWPHHAQSVQQLRAQWEQFWRQGIVQSSFDRPTVTDFICFAMEPTNHAAKSVAGVQNLALCLVTQLAGHLDEQASAMSQAAAWNSLS